MKAILFFALSLFGEPSASAAPTWWAPQGVPSPVDSFHAAFVEGDGPLARKLARTALQDPSLTLHERRNVRETLRAALDLPELTPLPLLESFVKFNDRDCERRPGWLQCPSEAGPVRLYTGTEEWLAFPLAQGGVFELKPTDVPLPGPSARVRSLGPALHLFSRETPDKKRTPEGFLLRILVLADAKATRPVQQFLTAWRIEPTILCAVATISISEPNAYEDLAAVLRNLLPEHHCGEKRLLLE